ncbi:MAG: VOC family protein [Paracraurococcus sp.]
MAKPIHSMIRVLDEARSVDFYRRALGLEVIDRLAFDGFTLLYLRAPEGPFELELTVNHDRTAPYALGDGYGHLAVAVEDLAAEHARMSAAGIEPGPMREMQHQGKPLAQFFFITDPDGYKTEVLQRFGRYA